jgi:hypothetical protein
LARATTPRDDDDDDDAPARSLERATREPVANDVISIECIECNHECNHECTTRSSRGRRVARSRRLLERASRVVVRSTARATVARGEE